MILICIMGIFGSRVVVVFFFSVSLELGDESRKWTFLHQPPLMWVKYSVVMEMQNFFSNETFSHLLCEV